VSNPLSFLSGPLGTLSVLATTPGKDEAEEQHLLDAPARSASQLWFGDTPRPSAHGQRWPDGSQPQETREEAGVGTWDGDLRASAVVWRDHLPQRPEA
jgi:hypothetical protein